MEDRYFSGNPDGAQYENHESVDTSVWVPEGYVCIRVDARGVCKSPGLQAPFSVQEAEDYYDAIEWAGTQPWSNGNVGLWGMSYLAMAQHNVASLQPSHLKAMIAQGTDADIYNEALYGGGIFGAGFWNWWYKIWSGNNHCGDAPRNRLDGPRAGHAVQRSRRPMARAADLHAPRPEQGHGAGLDRRPAGAAPSSTSWAAAKPTSTPPPPRRRSSISPMPGSRAPTAARRSPNTCGISTTGSRASTTA